MIRELAKRCRDDLTAVMDEYDVSCAELNKWCDVEKQTVWRWRCYGVGTVQRAREIVFLLMVNRPARFFDTSQDLPKQLLVKTLEFYADHTNYQHGRKGRDAFRAVESSADTLTVYKSRILNDRGARARRAMKEVRDA